MSNKDLLINLTNHLYNELVKQEKNSDRIKRNKVCISENTLISHQGVRFLAKQFHLSTFEIHVLLLCAAMVLDTRFDALLTSMGGENERLFPTFHLALSIFADANWLAVLPSSPLRNWHLLRLHDKQSPLTSRLSIDERILHFLLGFSYTDKRIAYTLLQPHKLEHLSESQRLVAIQITNSLKARSMNSTTSTIFWIHGKDHDARYSISNYISEQFNMKALYFSGSALPTLQQDLDFHICLIQREVILQNALLVIDYRNPSSLESNENENLLFILQRLHLPCLVLSDTPPITSYRGLISFILNYPDAQEQENYWTQFLEAYCPSALEQTHLAAQLALDYTLSIQKIYDVVQSTALLYEQCNITNLSAELQRSINASLDNLASRIDTIATWDQLVLPESQTRDLYAIEAQFRQRSVVYNEWGFSTRGKRGLGLSVLFSGPSGTGKTMAAEVLAHTLGLQLYRVDLATVVSKYVGETEKNLKEIFDTAEHGGILLLFDEADALFGKRTEIHNSHDRYANIEVSYLLQRMESFKGLAILTTNFKQSLDSAFIRRLRFVIDFPFPSFDYRKRIWKLAFPIATPTQDLDFDKLARLNITGGHIHNIALNAAFLAAQSVTSIQMKHLLQATHAEYTKLGKALTDAETNDWLSS